MGTPVETMRCRKSSSVSTIFSALARRLLRIQLQGRVVGPEEPLQNGAFEEELGEAGRTQHLVGHRLDAHLLLHLLHPVDGRAPEDPGPVGGPHGRRIHGGDDVPTRGMGQDLLEDVGRDLFRRDELHEAQGRQGFELAQGEEAVLAGVEVHALDGFFQST